MGGSGKCKTCGSSDVEVDPSRGDTVCTNCGSVLDDNAIVSEMQFEENAHGGATAIGQFVSSESSGGCRGFGNGFHAGGMKESREITLMNARRGLSALCQQLRLNHHCMETAYNFYKMALTRHLTKGRKSAHVLAACLYITCRLEGTPHLLIDLSDVIQICAFELGRTYVRLSQALCINIPSVDPCLYVLRFCNKLELGEKTHEVAMTALRLVQRMKKDSMHSGRRPSGICGAALLMASRLHGYSRTVEDIIKVVQIHKSTLKKRLVEFGETPSSSLTLQEFMTVDLEEEQDPPSYKLARAKDRERLKTLEGDCIKQFTDLQSEIETKLFVSRKRKHSLTSLEEEELEDDVASIEEKEEVDTEKFVAQSTLGIVGEYIGPDSTILAAVPEGAGPSIASMGLSEGVPMIPVADSFKYPADGDLDTEGINDDEIDSYIMDQSETDLKDSMWHSMNADYLQAQKEKEERLKKEKEEGKPEKKKRRGGGRKKGNAPANSAGEAIEKMLQEKKISAKINYDVLKSLSMSLKEEELESKPKIEPKEEVKLEEETKIEGDVSKVEKSEPKEEQTEPKETDGIKEAQIGDEGEEFDEAEEEFEEEGGEGGGMMSLAQLLNANNDDEYYAYDEDDY